jgi:hypothetical protein
VQNREREREWSNWIGGRKEEEEKKGHAGTRVTIRVVGRI